MLTYDLGCGRYIMNAIMIRDKNELLVFRHTSFNAQVISAR